MFMTEIDGIEVKEILEFPPAPGFGRFKTFFDGSSLAHPAKMHVELCAELIRRYTKPGDVVLDPMNGVGTTTILCMLLGRSAIGVELEEKFHNWCESSRKITEERIKEFLGALKKRPPVTGWCKCNPTEDSYEPTIDVKNPDGVIEKFPIKIETCEKCGKPIYPRFGKAVHICGDARRLSELLKEHGEEIRCVLFSPPYGNAISKQGGLCGLSEIGISCKTAREYSEDVKNIGNLPIGEVGGIIFSPPYSSISPQSKDKEFLGRIARDYEEGHPRNGQRITTKNVILRYEDYNPNNPLNISNLPHGEINSMSIDVVITSPPYSETLNEKKNTTSNLRREERLRTAGHHPEDFMGGKARNCQIEDGLRYSFNSENIGNLKHGDIDVVLTSPPYEESMGDKHHSPKGDEIVREKRHYNTYTETKKKDNIGNLRKETYLSAMLTVYEQCYLVLKQGGKMIVIVKPFVRNFKVVKLHGHTIKLCELAGFVLKEVLLFKLPQKSFWRILYQKKHGSKVKDLNLLDYEWVLVFEKP